MNTTKNNNFN